MNFKDKRPRVSRAGCKMCKRWKISGVSKISPIFESISSHKARVFAKQDAEE